MRVVAIVAVVPALANLLLSQANRDRYQGKYSEPKESQSPQNSLGRWLPNELVLVSRNFRLGESNMAGKTIRVVTRASNGTIRTKEFEDFDGISEIHEQIGIDDCSTDLSLRGMPIFRGLIGPMPESKTVVRYESPDVFEGMTKEWSQATAKRKRRRKPQTTIETPRPSAVPIPKMNTTNPMTMPTTVNF